MSTVPSRVAKTMVKYGMRYGPIVFEAVRHGQEPARRAVEKAWTRKRDRRTATAHAASVVNGSVLRTFHAGEPIWVVYSADVPVAGYPRPEEPLETITQHADLAQRVRVGPETLRSLPDRVVDRLPDPARELARKALRSRAEKPPK